MIKLSQVIVIVRRAMIHKMNLSPLLKIVRGNLNLIKYTRVSGPI